MKKCVLKVDDRIFCREAVLKASYLFLNDYYIHLSYESEHEISVELEAKSEKTDVCEGDIYNRFGNELIAQMVRYQLLVSNKGIRELIIGRALYSTCLDTKSTSDWLEKDESLKLPSLDDIAVDWFEKNEKSN